MSAAGHRAKTTARPRPAAVACDVFPTAAPAAAARPPLRPPLSVFRTTTAVVEPGVTTSMKVKLEIREQQRFHARPTIAQLGGMHAEARRHSSQSFDLEGAKWLQTTPSSTASL